MMPDLGKYAVEVTSAYGITFLLIFGCQHEAQNPSKIQVLKAMLGSLGPSLMIFGDMWGNLAL